MSSQNTFCDHISRLQPACSTLDSMAAGPGSKQPELAPTVHAYVAAAVWSLSLGVCVAYLIIGIGIVWHEQSLLKELARAHGAVCCTVRAHCM